MAERKLTLQLSVDDQGSIKIAHFNEQIKRTSGSVDSMSRSLSLIKWDAIVNLGEKAYRTAKQIYDYGKGIAEAGDQIVDMSKMLGMSTDEFQRWSYAAKQSDLDMGSFSSGVKIFSQHVMDAAAGQKESVVLFDAMKISIRNASGEIKPLSELMREVSGKMSGYADGMEKINLVTAAFGKGGMEWIEMLNKGSGGLDELNKRLERLGGPVGNVTLEMLAKSKEAFIDLDVSLMNIKLTTAGWVETLAGVVTWLSTTITKANELGKLMEGPGFGKGWIKFGAQDTGIGPELASTHAIIKPTAPVIPIPGKGSEEALKAEQKALEDNAKAWGDYADEIIKGLEKIQLWKAEDAKEILKLEQEQIINDSRAWGDYADEVLAGLEKIQMWKVEDARATAELEQKQLEETSKAWGDYADEVLKGLEQIQKWKAEDQLAEIKRTADFWGGTVESMANTFSSGFENVLIHGFDNIGDAFKDLGKMMLGELIKITGQLLFNQALYGSMMGSGGFSSGSAFGGLFGLLGMVKMQEGGLVTRPTIAMLGEKGPEAVIPLSHGGSSKGGGDTYNVFNITAWDAKGVNHWLRHGGARQIAGSLKNDHNKIAGSRANMI